MKRISKHLRLIVMATVILGITWSCQQEEELTPQSEDHTFLSESEMVGMTKLGKRLENPYSVENMKKALESLKTSNPNGRTSQEEIDITTTHLYIRFKPKDEDELSILKRDSTLVLYDYPLDYEIAETGDFYHDPEVPVDQPTYQYCAVEVGKELPEVVEYELLAELFIPDEDSDEEDENGRIASSNLTDALVDEALQITGNLGSKEDGSNARRSKWRPAGRVQVWDDRARRYVPVIDVEVRARRWFTTHEGVTNTQGNYSCNGRFRRDANYSIKWEKYNFSIRSGTFGQANDNGPKRRGSWNPDYGRNGSFGVRDTQQYYALIFQAARDYYYGNRFGLASPPRNSLLKPQVKISASQTDRQHNKNSHAAPYARTGGIFPSVYVRTWGSNADRVYAVTCHELAHMSHWDIDRNAFRALATAAWAPVVPFVLLNDREKYAAVIESWANGVEWQFAQQRYRNQLRIGGYEYSNNIQNQRIAPFNVRENDLLYTSLVVDMIDNCNQRTNVCYTTSITPRNLNEFPQDRVSGYTITQIEQGLRGARSWNQWRDNMINRHTNATENRLNELFSNWY